MKNRPHRPLISATTCGADILVCPPAKACENRPFRPLLSPAHHKIGRIGNYAHAQNGHFGHNPAIEISRGLQAGSFLHHPRSPSVPDPEIRQNRQLWQHRPLRSFWHVYHIVCAPAIYGREHTQLRRKRRKISGHIQSSPATSPHLRHKIGHFGHSRHSCPSCCAPANHGRELPLPPHHAHRAISAISAKSATALPHPRFPCYRAKANTRHIPGLQPLATVRRPFMAATHSWPPSQPTPS
ncbi:MAG: hypothetical protein OJF49_003118 [Ktedonobacterales bacterium]|jgi:hypothetical protein|nr:MAG: hypothetical protein OJF49_003118 [Ktedonobacterales bacterium]